VNAVTAPSSAHSHREPSNPIALNPDREAPPATSSTVAEEPEPVPDVQEVWFAGCHSDVGGGAVEDSVRHSLAEISLRWMVKQVVISKCGIKFDATALRTAGLDTQTWPEEDALADIHDELKIKPAWYLLEPLPMKVTQQDRNGMRRTVWRYAHTNPTP
jgi:hypothetical protein